MKKEIYARPAAIVFLAIDLGSIYLKTPKSRLVVNSFVAILFKSNFRYPKDGSGQKYSRYVLLKLPPQQRLDETEVGTEARIREALRVILEAWKPM